MRNLIAVFVVTILLVNIFGCKSKSEPEPPRSAKERQLSGNKWKLNAAETIPAIPGINALNYLEECYKDNIYTFLPGGTLSVDEGSSKCNVENPQVITGEWKLSHDEEQLDLKYADIDHNFKLLELTEEKMKVQSTLDFQGISILGTLTFAVFNE